MNRSKVLSISAYDAACVESSIEDAALSYSEFGSFSDEERAIMKNAFEDGYYWMKESQMSDTDYVSTKTFNALIAKGLYCGDEYPTLWITQKWLREDHMIDIQILSSMSLCRDVRYEYKIIGKSIKHAHGSYDTYETALDAAIYKSLEYVEIPQCHSYSIVKRKIDGNIYKDVQGQPR